jgi:hypothetical protein
MRVCSGICEEAEEMRRGIEEYRYEREPSTRPMLPRL